MWTSTWAEIASKMGLAWGQSYAIRKPRWAEVGAKGVEVEPRLGPCWPKLAPSGADVVAMSDRNGAFGRCCLDLQTAPITTVPCFLATCAPRLTDLSGRIHC